MNAFVANTDADWYRHLSRLAATPGGLNECLNVHWFLSLDDARDKIEAWRQEYNGYRPHRSLADLPPDEFAENHYAEAADSLLLAG